MDGRMLRPHDSQLSADEERQRRLRDRRVVYGVFSRAGVPSDVIFLPREQAEHTAEMFRAFCSVDTWGELRKALTREQASDLGAWLKANERANRYRSSPKNEAPFHPEDIPGLFDGAWPPWPDRLHVEWMPAVVVERFADMDHGEGGVFAAFDAADERRIVSALRTHGFIVERDNKLVAHACGYIIC